MLSARRVCWGEDCERTAYMEKKRGRLMITFPAFALTFDSDSAGITLLPVCFYFNGATAGREIIR